jgi:hypothetical protein
MNYSVRALREAKMRELKSAVEGGIRDRQKLQADLAAAIARAEKAERERDEVMIATDKVRRGLTCSRDRGYMAPHKKCRSCFSCKAAAEYDALLARIDAAKGGE